MRGYDAFSETLKDLKLLPVFGNPGTTELSALRHVEDYVLTLFDGISVGMADGFSQFYGSPSIVNLHSVPGLGNSMSFIYTAKMNRTPLIITAGQQDQRHLLMEPLLSGNLLSFVGENVKFKYELTKAEEIPSAIRKAKMIATTPPTGPVFLSIPMNLMDEEINYEKQDDISINYNTNNKEVLDYVSEIINSAKNPSIVFGWEVDFFNAFKEAEELAEKLGCAVYSEPLSHRAPFSSSSKYFAGDLMPGSTLINLKLLQNDVIIFLGGDITLYPYLPSPILKGKKVIFLGMNIQPKFGEFYNVNVKIFMRELKDKIKRKCNFAKPLDLGMTTKIANERSNMGINYVFSKIKKEFSSYTVVDEAVSSSYILRNFMGYSHNTYFTAKSGQLGWALPAGAGIAMKHNKTLAILGDGALMYSVQTLWTLKRYKIPLKIIVLKNGGYVILKSYASSYYPDMENKAFLNFDLDIEKISSSFGIESMVAGNDMDELKWLAEGEEPKLLVVNVDRSVPKLFL
ncbi:MAG: thiamine pyrophosphate-dependent enzyme [Thermoplasmata archaeon]